MGSPDLARLEGLLEARGARARGDDGALVVEGLTAEQVAQAALEARVLVTELTAEAPDLERAFFALTGGAVS